MTLYENSSVVTNGIQEPWVYPHIINKAAKTNFHAQDRARNTPIFLSANGEYFWLLSVATSKFGLLTIKRHSAAKKYLFRSPWGDRSGLRKPKMDMHQHQL